MLATDLSRIGGDQEHFPGMALSRVEAWVRYAEECSGESFGIADERVVHSGCTGNAERQWSVVRDSNCGACKRILRGLYAALLKCRSSTVLSVSRGAVSLPWLPLVGDRLRRASLAGTGEPVARWVVLVANSNSDHGLGDGTAARWDWAAGPPRVAVPT
jgi:hypothetical protein